jgi:Ser/Thr protein kinase RdoA (MazF antagonist)
MVDDFILSYSARKLGRDLTKSELEEIEDFITRRQVRDWAAAKAKSQTPKRTYKKKESVKDEQSIVDESVEEEADTSSE